MSGPQENISSPPPPGNISIISMLAREVRLRADTTIPADKNHINLNYKISPHRNSDQFIVEFDTDITSGQLVIKVIFITTFKADATVTHEFLRSPMASINAPAIAFPFLRSFVMSMTVNAGYTAVVLPTVNFVELFKNMRVANAPGTKSEDSPSFTDPPPFIDE